MADLSANAIWYTQIVHRINSILDIPSVLELHCMNLENLNFYGCTVECINSNAKAIYIWLGIWRCDGPERCRMLTVMNAYYGYYEILLICLILHRFIRFCIDSSDFVLIHLSSFNINIKFKVQHFQLVIHCSRCNSVFTCKSH